MKFYYISTKHIIQTRRYFCEQKLFHSISKNQLLFTKIVYILLKIALKNHLLDFSSQKEPPFLHLTQILYIRIVVIKLVVK